MEGLEKDWKTPRGNRRRADWPEALGRFLGDRKDKDFRWGVNDCALFVCDAIELLVSVDPAWDFRGTYDSRLGARKALRRAGYVDVEQCAAKIALAMHFEEIPPAQAQRGDLVVLDTDGGPALGLIGLNGEILTMEEGHGLVSAPFVSAQGLRPVARCAWRIA